MRNSIALTLMLTLLTVGSHAYAAAPSRLYPIQIAQNNTQGLQVQEKRNDNRLINDQGWDRRADKYVRTTRGTYDRIMAQYERDQKNHASAKQLNEDKTRVERAKQQFDVALADQRRSQSSLNNAQNQNKQYESQLNHSHQTASRASEEQIDNRLINKQGWDRRADKYILTTRGTYERILAQYERDQKNHASANQLSRDKARVERAKQKFDVALNDQRRSQSALNNAQLQNKQIENADRGHAR